MEDEAITRFLTWFTASGGSYDQSAITITTFPDAGRGAIALRDIAKDEILFIIPRDLLLSTRTSPLRALLSSQEWRSLGKGWASLILSMMREDAMGHRSKWCGYLQILPNRFDTPMFWTDSEIEELKGTTMSEKIGKEDAELEYSDKVLPLLQARPDLFPPSDVEIYYSLERFHIMGSRILSRSFHVQQWDEVLSPNAGDVVSQDMETDQVEDESDREEDDENPDDVSMVPFADLLNARYGCDNAKLFYEEYDLRMTATRHILAGEQIWNTYGDPPNSDLLRRYGHVDLVPLSSPTDLGNPSDEVEIKADLIVLTMEQVDSRERIDWWLEEGGEDTFAIDMDQSIPPGLISLVRLLGLPIEEWERSRDKGKLPKPKLDIQSLEILVRVLNSRMTEYPTSIQDDEQLLQTSYISRNKRNAVIVRLAEKRLLRKALQELQERLEQIKATDIQNASIQKRKTESEAGNSKRRKIS